MRLLGYGLGGCLLTCLILGALVYAVPAIWVAEQLARASGGRVQLAHTRGLWHDGRGILVLASASGGIDAVHWTQALQWNVSALRWPVLWRVRISLPDAGPPLSATLRAGFAGWLVQTAPWRGVVPLSALSGLGAPFNTLALQGDAQIEVAGLQFPTAGAAAASTPFNVEIRFAQLRSALAQDMVLGDYVVQGSAGSGGGPFVLRTLQGVLQLEGAGKCGSVPRLSCSFEGTARALHAQRGDARIANLLGLLGQPQRQNKPGNQTMDKDKERAYVTELRW
jgi:general secretion pathway protein N